MKGILSSKQKRDVSIISQFNPDTIFLFKGVLNLNEFSLAGFLEVL